MNAKDEQEKKEDTYRAYQNAIAAYHPNYEEVFAIVARFYAAGLTLEEMGLHLPKAEGNLPKKKTVTR
jgi:hypothetical protein